MSILVAVKVYDGLVIGADSQTSITATGPQGVAQVVKTYSNARKVFHLGDFPIGVGTYGVGNIGQQSMEGLILKFNDKIKNEPHLSVEEAARQLFGFIAPQYNTQFEAQAQKPFLGFMLIGYTKGHDTGEEWEFVLPQDSAPRLARPANQFGAIWRGANMWAVRLFFGIDTRLIEAARQSGATESVVTLLSRGFPSQIIFESMPLQDAVDFAEFVLNMTIGASRFEVGSPVCGGPIDLAIIRPDVGFKWYKQKSLQELIEI